MDTGDEEMKAVGHVPFQHLEEGNGNSRPVRGGFYQRHIKPRLEKGFLSNLTTFSLMVIGFFMVLAAKLNGVGNKYYIGQYVLAVGLFGFSAGFTNWIAIKMLFDRVPFLYGSGIIPRQFKQIRQAVKDTIMKTFFDKEYLEKYGRQKLGELAGSINIEEKVRGLLQSSAVDIIIDRKLAELQARQEGMILAMMGLSPEMLKPMVKPFVVGMASDVAPLLMDAVMGKEDGRSLVDFDHLRTELDSLMTTKLEELTPEMVKKLLEDVMRDHLGWLIVWGNLLGGLLGLVLELMGYSSFTA